MSFLVRKPNPYQSIALNLSRARQSDHRDPESFVYFIEAPEAEAIKVGVTKQIDRRFSTLQMASPFNLTLLGVVPGGHEHEGRIHLLFRKERLRGEWFRAGGFLRTFIDTVLKLPMAERTLYVEREPSVPESICRDEANAEARRCTRRLIEAFSEEVGPWKAARLYARSLGADVPGDDEDYQDGVDLDDIDQRS